MPSLKLKVLYILDILRELTDAQHRMSVPDIVEELEKRGVRAERKGIYRDLAALGEHGEDIVKTPTGYYLGRRMLDDNDLYAAVAAVNSARFICGERSAAIGEKLMGIGGTYRAEALRAGAAVGASKCSGDAMLKNMALLGDAIAKWRQVTFEAGAPRGRARRRGGRTRANPYALVRIRDEYFLICNVEGEESVERFRLDIIRALKLENQPWRHFSSVTQYKTRFDGADYAKSCEAMAGGPVRQVTVRCENALAAELFDRFGPDMQTEMDGPGHLCATLNVLPDDVFFSWVLSLGDGLEVLAPLDVRSETGERLAAAAAKYARIY